MRTSLFLNLYLAIALTFTSCKKELQPQDSSTAVRATDNIANKAANSQAITTTPTQNKNTTINTTAGMNPAHGQPGHRCDIAVGKPLNTPIDNTKAQTTPVQNIQNTNQLKNAGQPAITLKGMNPPHGQTGHRCDIGVGQPLNSKPKAVVDQAPITTEVKTNVEVTPKSETPTQGSVITPIDVPAPSYSTTPVAPGMNPPHGQEGHVCSVAVGQPLPKK
jgi:hypothetical protein